MITKDDDYDNDDVDDDDYGDDDQADDDIDDLLMHSRTLNHSRLGLLTSNNWFRQNLSRAITVKQKSQDFPHNLLQSNSRSSLSSTP